MPSLGRGLPIYGQESGLLARRWRTAAEREGGAVEPGEFPEGAAEAPEGLGRRSFLQVLGASAALAGLQACQPPREPLVPYVRPPLDVTPSIPRGYATAASQGGYAIGLVVTSWEGRPTKVEGNPAHPASRGGTDAVRQISTTRPASPGSASAGTTSRTPGSSSRSRRSGGRTTPTAARGSASSSSRPRPPRSRTSGAGS
jgi:hypothetical protein